MRIGRRQLLAAPGLLVAPAGDLAAGKILVASPAMTDEDFARTVVLLIQYGSQAAIGLVLNRPLKGQPPRYAGGPVAIGTRGLVRSGKNGFQLVTGADAEKAERVYLGYTGWSGPQLRDEVRRGLWRVMDGEARIIFDSDVRTLWERLSR